MESQLSQLEPSQTKTILYSALVKDKHESKNPPSDANMLRRVNPYYYSDDTGLRAGVKSCAPYYANSVIVSRDESDSSYSSKSSSPLSESPESSSSLDGCSPYPPALYQTTNELKALHNLASFHIKSEENENSCDMQYDGLDYRSSKNCAERYHHKIELKNELTEDYCSKSYSPLLHRRTSVGGDSYSSECPDYTPLDLSVTRSLSQDSSSLPFNNKLLMLADVCSQIIKIDKESSDTHYRNEVPNSLDSGSCTTTDTDDQSVIDELSEYGAQKFCGSHELSIVDFPCSAEQSMLRLAKGDVISPDDIILNSNVKGDEITSEKMVCFLKDRQMRLERAQELENYSSHGYSELQSQNSHDVEEYRRISVRRRTLSPKSPNGMGNSMDSKKRFRLAKHQYEKMSEEDRRVRHRVLDNQRSKQYRERRRKMVSTLQSEIHSLESENTALRDRHSKVAKKVQIMRLFLQQIGIVPMGETIYVNSQC